MSGHSKWSQIKRQKGITDVKRGKLFSKLLRLISIAAKTDPNPQFNPRLRAAVEIAKENQVPQDNIDRAISKATETKNLEDVTIEAYGPEGAALIIEGITDNTNRTIAEIRAILNDHNAKMANPGSVLWGFEKSASGEWTSKFPLEISAEGKEKLLKLMDDLDEHDDVQELVTNANI